MDTRLDMSVDSIDNRLNEAAYQSIDMFESAFEEEMMEESPKQNVVPKKNIMLNYQTLTHEDDNIGNIHDQTNLSEKVKTVKVTHQKKALRYQWDAFEEMPIEDDDDDVKKAKMSPGSLKNDIMVHKNMSKMPVNLQLVDVHTSDTAVKVGLSDGKTWTEFLVSKRYSYLFQSKVVTLHSIVTLHEVKVERLSKKLMICRMTIDPSIQVEKKLGRPEKI